MPELCRSLFPTAIGLPSQQKNRVGEKDGQRQRESQIKKKRGIDIVGETQRGWEGRRERASEDKRKGGH